MITEKDVNQAFDNLETAFNELAAIEDRQQELTQELSEYKDGSSKALEVSKKLQDLQPLIADAQRAYRLAGMKADRIRMLLDVAKTSMGKD